jgi:hypothetical protein
MDMMNNRLPLLQRGLLAGLAGGLAEIVWVSLYSLATGANAAVVARSVTTAVGAENLLPASPMSAGIVIHMLLAAGLGIALAFAWHGLAGRGRGLAPRYLFVLAALLGIWAMNFLIILPLISPAFVTLLPYPVSLISKLMFGVAAAETLRRTGATAPVRAAA